MPAERYFIDCFFQESKKIELKEAEFHHLAHVMRTRKGESIELVNGRGTLAQAKVEDILKNKAILNIQSVIQEPLKSCRLILAQALPKPNRLDFILEKGTELGVDAFWLFPGENSVKKELFPQALERCQQLTIAAMKQSGRLTLPDLIFKPRLADWDLFSEFSAFFGDVNPEALLFEKAWKEQQSFEHPFVFITGPESGFSAKETECLKSIGAQGVKLHANILRTDTASITALSLMSHWLLP